MTTEKVSVFTFSEAGGHSHNEDAFGIWPHPGDNGGLLVAIADGMGGQPGGGTAARTAVRAALEAASSHSGDWPSHLHMADERLVDPGLDDEDCGYTTLIGFSIRGNRIEGASAGDSAVLVIDAPGRAVELTTHQHKNPPVGSGEAVFVPFETKLTPPWLVLGMTDGVWKYAGWHRIRATADRLRGQELIDEIQRYARLPGSGQFQDDFTLIVVQSGE